MDPPQTPLDIPLSYSNTGSPISQSPASSISSSFDPITSFEASVPYKKTNVELIYLLKEAYGVIREREKGKCVCLNLF